MLKKKKRRRIRTMNTPATYIHIFDVQKLHQRLNEVTSQTNVLGVKTSFAGIVEV